MLPGLRFLFATVVLAVSVLIFGLGAAALLRASHEAFANLPSWRLAQQPQFAPKTDSRATLAMLRVPGPSAKPVVQDHAPTPPVPLPAVAPFASPFTISQPALAVLSESNANLTNNTQAGATDTPATQAIGQRHAQADGDEPPAPEAPAMNAEPADSTSAPEPDASVPAAAAALPDSVLPETRPTESRPSETEASDPQTTQTVTPQVRSTEATASVTLPKPVVRKPKRTRAHAVIRRRAITARAAPRVKPAQQQQQNGTFPLFGG